MLLLDMTLILFNSTLIITSSKIQIILSQCKQVFQKFLEHLKIPGARNVMWSKFHNTE